MAVFSALRLAKFNLDPRQSDGFIGVPTPAMATFFIGLPFLADYGVYDFILLPYSVIAISILSCYLLVSEIPIFSLKFKVFSFRENSWRYAFLLIIIILFLVYKFAALTPIVLVYILMSIIKNLIQR
jgi:CDP-diacylglycerol--serine O-phosphatidyltransferase